MSGSSRVGTEFGNYRLDALLGRGGMGEVYQAYDTDKGRTVALKILREEYAQDDRYRARFLRESQAAAVLQEPHVIPIHDWGEIDGNLFIDMRLVQGQTLHQIAGAGALDPQRAVGLIEQVAAALDAAHAEGLIHRDVKPQNIIVTPADFAYLVDFGIAETQGDARLTVAGTQIGSLAYMAPERFDDEPSTPAADIYSLACVLYEALTGSTPFSGTSVESQIKAHVVTPPPRAALSNPQVPAALDDVITRGMAKEPDDRYGSAGAFARAARRALEASPGAVNPHADTMVAPSPAPIPIAVSSATPGSLHAPVSAPVQVASADSRSWMLPTAVIAVAMVALAVLGVGVGWLMSKDSTDSADPPQTLVPATQAYAPERTVTHTVEVPTTVESTTTVAAPSPSPTTVRSDPEVVSLQHLRSIATQDRAFITAQLENWWVPQISSKRPGVVDDGYVWDNALTLEEHLQLRQRYNAKLLWSGDWSVFDAPNFWVTVVPAAFYTAEGALNWCTLNGFDRSHCLAKRVSSTLPPKGSTAMN